MDEAGVTPPHISANKKDLRGNWALGDPKKKKGGGFRYGGQTASTVSTVSTVFSYYFIRRFFSL